VRNILICSTGGDVTDDRDPQETTVLRAADRGGNPAQNTWSEADISFRDLDKVRTLGIRARSGCDRCRVETGGVILFAVA